MKGELEGRRGSGSLPYQLRYRLAWDHGLARAVLGVYARVLQDFYSRGAPQQSSRKGRTGMLTVIQRFGSGVDLHVHFHILVLLGSRGGSRSGTSRHDASSDRATVRR
jgi:hypothetical protein